MRFWRPDVRFDPWTPGRNANHKPVSIVSFHPTSEIPCFHHVSHNSFIWKVAMNTGTVSDPAGFCLLVFVMLYWCLGDAAMMFQWRLGVVSVVSWWCLGLVFLMLGWCFRDVIMTFAWCFSDVTAMARWHDDALVMSRSCFGFVTVVFQRCFGDVSVLFQY